MSAYLRGCVVILILLTTLHAQQQPPDKPIFRSSSLLIVETVTVKDKEGRPIEGLSAKDFTLTEDGEPQTISFVEFQRLPGPGAGAPAGADPAEAPRPPATVPPPTQTQIAVPPPGDTRYRDRRLIVLYFDPAAMPPPDQMRAYTNALKFVDSQMGPADLLAIIAFQRGAVRVRQDFTDNRALLREVLQTLIFGDDQDGDGVPDPLPGTAFGQDEGEFNIFNTDRQLAALQTAVTMLQPVPGQKSLIYFASGLRLNGTDNQAQLRATVNAAVRANVAIHTIDARGLVATPPLGDATRPSPGGIGMFSGRFADTMATNFQRSQDSLYALAKDTGGRAMFDYNDLSAGIVQAAESMTSYYLVGYYSSHTAADGRFRRVRVSLNGGLEADLVYRQGYFGEKAYAKFTAADNERQLEDALMLEDPITDIPMAMEVNYFQLNRAQYFVPVAVKIPGSELALAKRGGAQRTVIDFIGIVKDEYGYTIQNVRDKLDIRLNEDTAAQLTTRPIQYETGFTLLPGKYVLKLLARDAETGRIGTYQASFTVPNLLREERRVPISTIVLGSQRVPLTDSLYTVKQKISADDVNPLVFDGQKLIPSVTRVFSRSRELHVFLQAYQRTATVTQPLVAFVSFYRGQVKVFETPPLAVSDGLDPRTKAVPLRFSLSLAELPPGQYDCQVTVLDPTGQKAAFWQAPIVLVP
ncbi:MAG TPA: VWA domain-containing protein [Vicinamibacterales bacterium]|nr:VWA domain-containing protein [Vicinamibacterales bacterium]